MNDDFAPVDQATALRRAAAEAALLARVNYERADIMPYRGNTLKLARMHELLERVGNPQLRLPVIHVAGTKGKGSVSTSLATILGAAGLRTGLFTSPHLDAIEQRMMVAGAPCSTETFVRLTEAVWPHVLAMDAAARGESGSGPTYFEITTAMALLFFLEQQCDAVVLEVGLGGRLDSTNVCQPAVCVITSISFDHTKQLGNTLAAIAGEKAGIIKPGVPVVSGVTGEEAAEVIRRRAAECGCRLVELGRDFDVDYRPPQHVDRQGTPPMLDYRARDKAGQRHLSGVELNLLGRHQAQNAAVTIATIEELRRAGWILPEAALRRGLRETVLPARIEIVGRQPTVVVDAAHNVASVRALVETLETSFAPAPRLLLLATTRDKDVRGMLEQLLPAFDEIALTRYRNNPRSVSPEELAAIAASIGGPPWHTFEDPDAAWAWALRRVTPDHLICATGSFFFAAEMRRLIAARPVGSSPDSALEPV